MRWPGSVHRKREPRLAVIVSETENELDLNDAFEALRAACPAQSTARARPGADTGRKLSASVDDNRCRA